MVSPSSSQIKQVSQESYRAVLAGKITLQRAKELGRSGAPTDTPQASDGRGRASSGPREGRRPRPCIACGGMTKGGRFHPGCDQKLFGELKRNLQNDPLLRNERFSEEQKAYARERGLI
jgi:hypothetical protein